MSTIAAIMALYKRKAFKGFLSYGSFSNVSNYIMIIGILLCVAIGYGDKEGVEAALLAPHRHQPAEVLFRIRCSGQGQAEPGHIACRLHQD